MENSKILLLILTLCVCVIHSGNCQCMYSRENIVQGTGLGPTVVVFYSSNCSGTIWNIAACVDGTVLNFTFPYHKLLILNENHSTNQSANVTNQSANVTVLFSNSKLSCQNFDLADHGLILKSQLFAIEFEVPIIAQIFQRSFDFLLLRTSDQPEPFSIPGSTDVTSNEAVSTNSNTPIFGTVYGVFFGVSITLIVIFCVGAGFFLFTKLYKKKVSSRAQTLKDSGISYNEISMNVLPVDNGRTSLDPRYAYISSLPSPYLEVNSSMPSNPYEASDEEFNIPEKTEEALYDQIGKIFIRTIQPDDIEITSLIGSGQFGNVYKGMWTDTECNLEVAVKTLKENASAEDRIKFLQEATIMGQFKHNSIVSLYGIVSGMQIFLVLELLAKGDLRNYLISSRQKLDHDVINEHNFVSYCRQILFGMHYLGTKNFIHRDLAARNILVSHEGICKIADFGMSRDLLYQDTYKAHGGMIPVKWTAPEALLYKTYSTASDMWSYGIVLYEIWSVGHKPYEDTENTEVLEFLQSGKRLAPPPGTPRAIYDIMIKCWNSVPSKRPNTGFVCQRLSASDLKLLSWLEKDKLVHPEAAVLGADLSCSENLYPDLQMTYHNQQSQ